MLGDAMTILGRYDEVFFKLASVYSTDASLLSPYATEEEVDQVRAFQHGLETTGQRLVGAPTYRNQVVQEYDPAASHLAILLCTEISDIRLIDANGADVTPADRPIEDSLRISFDVQPSGLKIKESVVWTGASVC